MSANTHAGLRLAQRPRWDSDGGIWYCIQGAHTNGQPTKMYRHVPSINTICEPLMGQSVQGEGKKIIGVKYPVQEEAERIFREALERVIVLRDYHDLFTLAKFRRQVTVEGDMDHDVLFFNLACDAQFSREQWAALHTRMPESSWIQGACYRRATLGPDRQYAAA